MVVKSPALAKQRRQIAELQASHRETGKERSSAPDASAYKLLGGVAVAVLLAVVAYKLLVTSYDPIVFQGKTYEHVEEVSANDYVKNHFFSVGGKEMPESTEWIQVTNLSAAVTLTQRTMVDQQIKTTMRLTAVPGHEDRLFGIMQGAAVYALLLESSYVIYVNTQVTRSEEELRLDSGPIFDDMAWIKTSS